ncbi:sensor histidine kinase [Acutalibacter sp. 1XD8-33]|uniref:sensor histidine kinase n=1 Tax=Acutalibacter sp. 1XD8-33 TaxID=2320081 RepID=UPI0013146D57|nr:HAMP domain-containing sensor histidine kinase [Acutalibacter sp. 1XD8-33]
MRKKRAPAGERKRIPMAVRKRTPMGVRWQMALGFGIFALVTVTLLWIFQIFLLRPFYRGIKTSEAKKISAAVVRQLDGDNLASTAHELCARTGVSLYVGDELGKTLIGYQYLFRESMIYSLSRQERVQFFEQVNLLGGEYSRIFQSRTPIQDGSQILLYAVTLRTPQNNYRMVVVEAEITPLNSTVETLLVQLICLTLVLLPLGAVLAAYIPRRIARPLTEINESAKRLGQGDYSVRFAQRGAKEVSELAQTLNFAAGELSKTDSLRRELLANVSHDLRTPLTMIKGYAEVMRDLPGENTPENVQTIIDEAGRLNDLVNDLLDLSRLQAGVIQLETARFNLTESIREILSRYDRLADYSFPFQAEEDVYVVADQLKISQVVYNLVNNAVNYAGEDKTVSLRQELREGRVRVFVTDTGEGIPADKLQDIWDRYYKVDREHRRTQVGTGLGLSIVKNVLDMHGGAYGVISQVGKGSTFWFELEAAPPEAQLPPG